MSSYTATRVPKDDKAYISLLGKEAANLAGLLLDLWRCRSDEQRGALDPQITAALDFHGFPKKLIEKVAAQHGASP
jgi:hypothetical protein